MDKNLSLDFVRVTEAAALAASRWVGKGDKHAADQAATEAMRTAFSEVDINATVVIGEGERDEAPMLYIGEKVGTGEGPEFDIAVDPLEGTTPAARGDYNSICVLAAAPKGCLLHAPDTYMDKIAVGPEARGAIDLDATPEVNIQAVAKKLGKPVDEVTVLLLDRERNQEKIDAVRKAGARVQLIRDGDVAGAIATAIPDSGVDLMLGIGAAPEGVLAAAALKCLHGEFQGRLWMQTEEEKTRAEKMGTKDVTQKFTIEDLVKGEQVLFAATGVTDGPMLKGVRFDGERAVLNSVIMRSLSGTVRFMEAKKFIHN